MKTPAQHDEILERVWNAREKMLESIGHDLKRLDELNQRLEEKWAPKIRVLRAKPRIGESKP